MNRINGIKRGLTPPDEITENIYDMNAKMRRSHGIEDLPGTLEEALGYLKADELMLETLGTHVSSQFIAGKEAECYEYKTRVSNWEIAKYMIAY